MLFAPKGNVRVQLTLAILLVILLSWLCSTIMSNYLILQEMRTLRQTMLMHPESYPRPLPEPRLGWRELLLGPAEPIRLLDEGRLPRRISPPEPPLPPPGSAGDDVEPGPPGPRPQQADGPDQPPHGEDRAGRDHRDRPPRRAPIYIAS